MKNNSFSASKISVSGLIFAVTVFVLAMFNVSHCTQQAGIDKTVIASEIAVSNTAVISDRQTEAENNLKAERLSDSVIIIAQSELIRELKKATENKIRTDSTLAEKSNAILAEIIRAGKLADAHVLRLSAEFSGRKMTDTVFVSDSIVITETRKDTVYIKQKPPFSTGKITRRSVRHRKIKIPEPKINKTTRAKNDR